MLMGCAVLSNPSLCSQDTTNEVMDPKELIAQCCWHLQQSHLCIAKNDLLQAKRECVSASTNINMAMKAKNNYLASMTAEVAKFTINFFTRLNEKGLASLLAQDKLQWLASSNADRDWFPVLQFGDTRSTAIAPIDTVDDMGLKLPKLSSDFAVEFNETVARLSIERQISALKFDSFNRSIKPGTLALSDLYQDLLTNCSFVLSLLSIAELGMELDLRSLVTFHGNSRAKVELLFNGSKREIPITTRLPFVLPPHDSRSLHVRSLSSEALTWPAILEKAFVIALGEDYTFSGSNMAQDTYALIGWIPEIRKISESTVEEIFGYWQLKEKGMVALGVGTGPMSEKLAEQLEVVPEHDYVLSQFDDKEKVLVLRNPWTAETLTEKSMQQHLKVDLSLLGQFSYLYINWNPEARSCCRVSFPCVPLSWPEIFLADKPQYTFTNNTDKVQEIIVLVEKYFRNGGDMCVSVWEGAKNLIYTTTEYSLVEGGVFTDLRLNSLKFIAKPKQHYLVSVSSHDKKPAICSLAIFHEMESLTLRKAKPQLPLKTLCITGNWLGTSRGGNWANESYINNPQYDLKILFPDTSLAIVLASKNPNIEVSAHLFHCEPELVGKKLRTFDKSKLIVNENYSRLICLLRVSNLDPGDYKLVVSAFECKENDEFQVIIAHDSERDLDLIQVPQALGTFVQKQSFEWGGRRRTKFLISSDYKMTKFTAQILAGSPQLTLGSYIPAVRASVFDLTTENPILVTNEWDDSLYGVFLDCELPENHRDYILLIERFEPGEGNCRVEIGSTSHLTINELLE